MGVITTIDERLFELVSSLSNSFMDYFFKFFTYLGNAGMVWIIAGLAMLFFQKTRRVGCCMLVCLALTFLLNDIIIKPIIHRARPFVADPTIKLLITAPGGYSFPSGHTAAAFSSSTAIFLHNKKYGLGAYLLALLIGVSRIYLFAHYPTDVICGLILGIICGVVFTRLYDRLETKLIEKINGDGENEL